MFIILTIVVALLAVLTHVLARKKCSQVKSHAATDSVQTSKVSQRSKIVPSTKDVPRWIRELPHGTNLIASLMRHEEASDWKSKRLGQRRNAGSICPMI